MAGGVSGIGSLSSLRLPSEIPGLDRATERSGAGSIGGAAAPLPGAPGATSFGDTMKDFLGSVNDVSLQADQTFQAFVRGDVKDLHTVALQQQEAAIAVRLVTEMRDKLLQAYQEVMRMQM